MAVHLRTALTLYVFGVLGVFLLVVPWTPVWGQASRLVVPAAWNSLVSSGWTRGVVSGLGALDLLVATGEAAVLWRGLWEQQRERDS